jgi:hypothetical protein
MEQSVPVSPVDGFTRSLEDERRLNELAAAAAGSEAAQHFLDYLKSITINYVRGPLVTDAELRHIEGQRYIVAIIERRIQLGRERKPELPGERN